MNSAWKAIHPELDPSPLEIIGRVLVIAKHLEKSVTRALAEHDLTLGHFDILATLRRKSAETENNSPNLPSEVEEVKISNGSKNSLVGNRRSATKGELPRMTPKQLLKSVMLSSGGMTNRLDRLEQAGLIERLEDPDDRRGVVVGLTAKGEKVIDEATATRFSEAQNSLPKLTEHQFAELTKLLRLWLVQLSQKEIVSQSNEDAS